MKDDNSKTNATKVYSTSSDDALKTASYGTQTDSRTDRTTAHNLGAGDTVHLAGGEYRIESIISGEKITGEAVIYLIRDNTGNDFALKLYYPFRDPHDEPNSEALKRIKDIDNPDILKLHHFGTGAEKFNGQFCYEISDFAKGGDLLKVENIKEKYSPEFIERHVIKEIFKGIQILHENRIYHCDLKPQNVFYRDENQKDLVIGDYGSAKTFEQSSEKELSYMSVVKGTDFYLAPEQAIGIISEKNDYYSFGMIILHLLYPEKIDQQTLRKIYERRAAEKPIIDYDPKYKRLSDLIAGLTLQDIQQRWGQKEVSLWLAGKSVAVHYKKAAAPSVMPVKLRSKTIETEEDLLEYVQKGDDWHRFLIEDQQGYNLLLTWVSQVQDLDSKQSFDKLMRIAAKQGKLFIREAILRYFQPDLPVKLLTLYDVFQADDIETLTVNFLKELDDQWKIIRNPDLPLFSFIMALEQYADSAEGDKKKAAQAIIRRFLKAFGVKSLNASSQKELKKALKKSATGNEPLTVVTGQWDLLSKEITDEGMIRIFYDFNPARGFRDLAGNTMTALEEVALCFAGNPGLWKDRFLSAERKIFLEKTDRVLLNAKERSEFLLDVFKGQLLNAVHIEKWTPMLDSDRVNLKYTITGSLTDFLQSRNILEELNSKPISGSVTVSDFSLKSPDVICTEIIKYTEIDQRLPEKKWSPVSLEQLHTDTTLYQKTFISDIQQRQKRIFRSDLMQSVRSFIMLLPVIPLYLLYLSGIDKNHAAIGFLSGILPFTFDVSGLGLSENTVFAMAGNMAVLMFVSIIPSWIACRCNLGWIFGFVITHVTLIAVWFITPVPMAALSLIANPAVLYIMKTSRVRIWPFLVSVVPVLMIIFITDILFKDTPPSAKVRNPLNAIVLIRNASINDDKPVFMHTGLSEDDPVVGRIVDKDSLLIIDEKKGWYLVRNQGSEGFAQSEKIGLPGYLKMPGWRPSADVTCPMNMHIYPKSNEALIRAGKSDANAVLGTVIRDEFATVLAVDSGWYLVRHKNHEGYLKINDVNEEILKKGRLINRYAVARKEPSASAKALRSRVPVTLNIYSEHEDWYLIRTTNREYGYIMKKDIRILQ